MFGFTKNIPHQNDLHQVAGCSFVEDDEISLYNCKICHKHFKSKAGLTMHISWCTSKRVDKKVLSKSIPIPLEEGCAEIEDPQKEVEKESTVAEEETVECQDREKSAEQSTAEEEENYKPWEKRNRRSYDNEFKLKVIEETKMSQKNEVALKYNISKSMVTTWVQNERKIADTAVDRHMRLMKKIRPSTKHKQLFVRLNQKFLQARSKGLQVSFAWLYVNARKIQAELNQSSQSDEKVIPKSAIFSFIKTYGIKLRRIQCKKRANKTNFLPGMIGWHATLREGLIKTGNMKPSYDNKWGRFRPSRRFNVDQVPMPIHGEQRQQQTWVSTPGPGLDKRQCTLQICFAPEGPPLRIGIIFRGTGTQVSTDEKNAYYKDVDVYWQANAWADVNFSINWVTRTLKPVVMNTSETNKEFVLSVTT